MVTKTAVNIVSSSRELRKHSQLQITTHYYHESAFRISFSLR